MRVDFLTHALLSMDVSVRWTARIYRLEIAALDERTSTLEKKAFQRARMRLSQTTTVASYLQAQAFLARSTISPLSGITMT